MTNTLNSNVRHRTNQLIKVEKENENLELKKKMKMKSSSKDKSTRRETVWDRLSKVRKTPSSENVAIARSRQNLSTKPSQRFQIMKQMAEHQLQQHQLLYEQQQLQQQQQQLQQQQQQQHQQEHQSPRRPLTPNSSTNHRRSSRKYPMQKAIIVPEIDNQGFVYVCKPLKSVKEIVTARSLSTSKSSSEDNKNAGIQMCPEQRPTPMPKLPNHSTNKTLEETSEDSGDEFKLAPLMSSRSYYDLPQDSSAKIIHNFQQVLHRRGESSLEPEELEMVKNIIKYDDRYHNLDESDPKLFKDILRTQLQDIVKHEYAIKQALVKLESSGNVASCRQLEPVQPMGELMAYPSHAREPQKLEVDVVFKNVPSLEKEIVILRALGKRLEATLKSSNSQKSLVKPSPEIGILNSPKTLGGKMRDGKMFMLIEIKQQSFVLGTESQAVNSVHCKGLRLVTAQIQEFRIAHKTLVELKQEANRSFYIPVDPETAELKRTSFKKLQQNPDILLRHIKAKNDRVPFNVLDHDPVFFHNFLLHKNQSEAMLSTSSTNDEEHTKAAPQPTLCEGGDSQQFHRKFNENPKKCQIKANATVVEEKETPPKIMESKGRRRIRRSLTPFPVTKEVSPKNNLFKTILVGSVQLSCFMLLIVAFTFPEATC